MSNMVFGMYTLTRQPNDMTMIHEDRINAHVLTHGGVAFFSWGPDIVGKEIDVYWNIMPSSQYEQLLYLYTADATIVFDPQDGEGRTFNVEIISLDGKYHVHLDNTANHMRKDVRMRLLVLSEVA